MKKLLFLDTAKLEEYPKLLKGEKKAKNQTVRHYKIIDKDKGKIKRETGDYFTIQFTDKILTENPKVLQKEVQKIVNQFLKKYHNEKPILVIGLGNSNLNVDAFGSLVTNKMIATNQYNDFLTIPKVALFNPDVISKTGISSFKLIQLVVQDLNPDLIIILDSLATKNNHFLNRVIEISDTGIIPGSALRNSKKIDRNTFHIPILSIGIPFLYQTKENIFASAFLDQEINILSNLIADSLNQSILF